MITSLPSSRVPDPALAPPLRWGVLGPGTIAHVLAGALQKHSRQQVVAVGSRSRERADQFAAEFDVPRVHTSYEELVADPGVDVVYVATPHSHHHAQALLAIAAGKHVLVEKAFTRNASEAREVADAARAAGVVVLESMWSRFLPGADVLRQLLSDGALGEVSSLTADHGQLIGPDDAQRLHDPRLAGGALLDLGIYPVSFASLVLGPPQEVTATGSLTTSGVDEQVTAVLRVGAAQATLTTTLRERTHNTARVTGDLARVDLPADFYTPVPLTLTSADGRRVLTADPGSILGHEGLVYQAAHLAQLVADGATDSPLLPLDETISILATTDEIRRQLGVTFPGE
ncbi:Gfo/Idh/MocA family protein [Ornithinimicrobium cryptoxanthini]|uniref:Gfo/Idh/MocA family protein n=1 Tax=Ornithinimicrobium cryptoxanthini TaxID=2934161 RepID=UPI0021176C6F|nr:Gfo/Idh/MocA family oxidoreductase [Ornithinimicrobium cryptoxanthini]